MTGFIAAAADELERRAAESAAAEAQYGRQVAPNVYERYEDGVLVSSFVVEGEYDTVVYRFIGLSFAEII